MQRFRLFRYHIIHPEEEILLFSDTFKGWDAMEQKAPVPYFVNNLFIRSLTSANEPVRNILCLFLMFPTRVPIYPNI
jgi:hypothetical protein